MLKETKMAKFNQVCLKCLANLTEYYREYYGNNKSEKDNSLCVYCLNILTHIVQAFMCKQAFLFYYHNWFQLFHD